MTVEIKITTSSGDLLPATQELIEQWVEAFAEANRRAKEVRVSVDDGDPAKPVVEVIAVIGTENFVGTGSAGNILKAVEAALGKIQSQRSQQRQERGAERKSEEDAADSDGGMKVVGGVAGILFVGVFAVIMARSGCGDGPHANYGDLGLVDVSGTITLDGQPLADAVVTFEDPASGRFSYGQTDADGDYELQLDSEMEGVVPGRKIVRISTSRTILGLNSDSEGPPGEGGEEEGEGEGGGPRRRGGTRKGPRLLQLQLETPGDGRQRITID